MHHMPKLFQASPHCYCYCVVVVLVVVVDGDYGDAADVLRNLLMYL